MADAVMRAHHRLHLLPPAPGTTPAAASWHSTPTHHRHDGVHEDDVEVPVSLVLHQPQRLRPIPRRYVASIAHVGEHLALAANRVLMGLSSTTSMLQRVQRAASWRNTACLTHDAESVRFSSVDCDSGARMGDCARGRLKSPRPPPRPHVVAAAPTARRGWARVRRPACRLSGPVTLPGEALGTACTATARLRLPATRLLGTPCSTRCAAE